MDFSSWFLLLSHQVYFSSFCFILVFNVYICKLSLMIMFIYKKRHLTNSLLFYRYITAEKFLFTIQIGIWKSWHRDRNQHLKFYFRLFKSKIFGKFSVKHLWRSPLEVQLLVFLRIFQKVVKQLVCIKSASFC